MQTLSVLVSGFEQVKEEVRSVKPATDRDHFVKVMQASILPYSASINLTDTLFIQPFVAEFHPSIEALRKMGEALDADLRTLLMYYGEVAEGPDARRPEDFFGLVLSFSSALQVSVSAQMKKLQLDDGIQRNLHWMSMMLKSNEALLKHLLQQLVRAIYPRMEILQKLVGERAKR